MEVLASMQYKDQERQKVKEEYKDPFENYSQKKEKKNVPKL